MLRFLLNFYKIFDSYLNCLGDSKKTPYNFLQKFFCEFISYKCWTEISSFSNKVLGKWLHITSHFRHDFIYSKKERNNKSDWNLYTFNATLLLLVIQFHRPEKCTKRTKKKSRANKRRLKTPSNSFWSRNVILFYSWKSLFFFSFS